METHWNGVRDEQEVALTFDPPRRKQTPKVGWSQLSLSSVALKLRKAAILNETRVKMVVKLGI